MDSKQRYMVAINTRRIIIAAFVWMLTACAAHGQQKTEKDNPYKGLPFKDRIFFGGDFGLSFGDITYIRVAPLLGYHVNRSLAVGGGPNYQYLRIRHNTPNGQRTAETHIYGMNTFARQFVFDPIFIQTDFEVLNLRSSVREPGNFFDERRSRITVPVWLVGVGYGQRSGRGGLMIGLFYDLIGDRNSPYGRSMIIRAGFFF